MILQYDYTDKEELYVTKSITFLLNTYMDIALNFISV